MDSGFESFTLVALRPFVDNILRSSLDVAVLIEVYIYKIEEKFCRVRSRRDRIPNAIEIAGGIVDRTKVTGFSLRHKGELVKELICRGGGLVNRRDDDELTLY